MGFAVHCDTFTPSIPLLDHTERSAKLAVFLFDYAVHILLPMYSNSSPSLLYPPFTI